MAMTKTTAAAADFMQVSFQMRPRYEANLHLGIWTG